MIMQLGTLGNKRAFLLLDNHAIFALWQLNKPFLTLLIYHFFLPGLPVLK